MGECDTGVLAATRVCIDGGPASGPLPLRVSFKGAMQEMMGLWPFSASAARQRDLTAFYDALLRVIATHKVPLRPGRYEPRVRKRRPKSHPLMTKPRPQLKKELLAAHP